METIMSLNSTLAPALISLLHTSLDAQAQIRPIPIIITSTEYCYNVIQRYTVCTTYHIENISNLQRYIPTL